MMTTLIIKQILHFTWSLATLWHSFFLYFAETNCIQVSVRMCMLLYFMLFIFLLLLYHYFIVCMKMFLYISLYVVMYMLKICANIFFFLLVFLKTFFFIIYEARDKHFVNVFLLINAPCHFTMPFPLFIPFIFSFIFYVRFFSFWSFVEYSFSFLSLTQSLTALQMHAFATSSLVFSFCLFTHFIDKRLQ